MLFMVIEHFRNGNPKPVYERFRDQGRMMPDGISYEGSWIDIELKRCFQLMSCDNAVLLQEWVANWNELVDFEIVAVVESKETSALLNRLVDQSED